MVEETAPTHAPSRITELTFANALIEGPRVFTGMTEIGVCYDTLVAEGIDPSFALGHFWVESQFATAGWNIWSDPRLKSWGNILYVNSQVKNVPGVTEYKASNGYEYASYPNWEVSIRDYCLLLHQYRDRSPDTRYGDTSTIAGTCAKWAANPPGSDEHLKYVDIVLGRMARYDQRPPWEGEMAIVSDGISYTSNQRYLIKTGERWFVKPGGLKSYEFRAGGQAIYFGRVEGTSWVAIKVQTARFSPDGKAKSIIAYVPNYQASRVTSI